MKKEMIEGCLKGGNIVAAIEIAAMTETPEELAEELVDNIVRKAIEREIVSKDGINLGARLSERGLKFLAKAYIERG